MPFKSEAQRKYMYSQHPEIAKRWTKEGKRKESENESKKSEKIKFRKRGMDGYSGSSSAKAGMVDLARRALIAKRSASNKNSIREKAIAARRNITPTTPTPTSTSRTITPEMLARFKGRTPTPTPRTVSPELIARIKSKKPGGVPVGHALTPSQWGNFAASRTGATPL